MKYYRNLSGESGITAFEFTQNGILIEFKNGGLYEYTNNSAGRETIRQMKFHARNGIKLNSFINGYSRKLHSRKLK